MKKSILLLIFICFSIDSYSQIVKGTVLDKDNKKPVTHASIYISGTMVGTNSDDNGLFKLDVSKYLSMPLSISALGYDQVTLAGFSSEEPVVVYMTPKVFELKDVVISGKSLIKARKANLKIFRSCFLGTTPNGLLSNILNEEDIHFKYDESDTVRAYSSKPIIIENKGLGYIVSFFLDEFEYDRRNNCWFFLGNILFNEDLNIDESLKKRYEKRRRNAFLGSKMQFLRALWNNELDSTGFQVSDIKGKNLAYKDIVIIDDDDAKFLWYPEMLVIYYRNSEPAGSIIFKEEKVYFDQSGYFDALNIIWGGKMSRQLIGDWLPYEYILPVE
jgi:hypothetical protein